MKKKTATVKAEFVDKETGKAVADPIELPDVKWGKHSFKELLGDKLPKLDDYKLLTDLTQELDVNDDNKTLKLEYEKKTTTVTAKFVDQQSKEEVAKSIELPDVKFGKQTLKDLLGDKLPDVSHYKLTTDLNQEVEINDDHKTVTLEYAKKTTTVTAQFVDKETNETVAKAIELPDVAQGKHTLKELIGDKLPEVASYKLATDLSQEVDVDDDHNTVTFKYEKKTTTVTAKFIDKETGQEVSKSVDLPDIKFGKHALKDLLGDKLPELKDYKLITDLTQEVDVNDENKTVMVEYEKKTTTVKAQFIDQETSQEIALPIDLPSVKYGKHTIKDLMGDKVPEIYYYQLTTDLNQEFEVNDENKMVTLYYAKKIATVRATFIDNDTHQQVAKAIEIKDVKYGRYTMADFLADKLPTLTDYTQLTDLNQIVNVNDSVINLRVEYEKKTTTVKAEFVDEKTDKAVADPIELSDVRYGKHTIKALIGNKVPTVKGYQLKTDLNQEVEINADHKALKLKYEKVSTAVQARFIDQDNGEEIAKSIDLDDVKYGKHTIKDLIGDQLPTLTDYKLTTDLNEEVEISEANTIVTVKYAKKTATIKAEFVDQETGKEVAKPVELSDVIYGKHTIQELLGDKLPTLADYTLKTDLSQEVTVGDDNKPLTLKYEKKTATVKANFVDKETGKEVAKSVELTDVKYGKHTMKDLLGDKVPTVDTYTLATDLNQEVEINDGNQTLTVQYEKKTTTVKAQFIDQTTGAEVAVAIDLPNVKYGKHTIKDLIGDQLPMLTDYKLLTDLNQEVEVSDENNTLTLKYEKKTTTLKAEFVDNETGKEVAKSIELTDVKFGKQPIKDVIGDQLPTVDGYQLVTDLNEEFEVNENSKTLTLKYEKKTATVKAEFIDQETGKEVAKPVDLADVTYGKHTMKDLLGDKLPTVDDYKLVTDLDQEVTIDDDHKTLTVKYEKKTATVKAEFVDKATGKAVAEPVEIADVKWGKHSFKDLLGDKLPKLDDYKLLTDLAQEIDVNDDTKMLTVEYAKKTTAMTASFVDKETNEAVAKSVELPDVAFGKHTLKELIGDKLPDVASYKLVTDLSQEVDVDDDHNTVTFKYEKKTTTVTAQFIDQATGKAVAEAIELADVKFGKHALKDLLGDQLPTLNDYTLITDLNQEVDVNDENKTVTLNYEKKTTTVKAQFIDQETGQEIALPIDLPNVKFGKHTIKDLLGDQLPIFNDYQLTTDLNEEFDVNDDNKTVTLKYAKKTAIVKAQFLDKETGEEVAKAIEVADVKYGKHTIKELVGDKLPTLADYKLATNLSQEVIVNGDTTVVVHYEKKTTAVKAEFVDDKTGKEVAPSIELSDVKFGTHALKDLMGDQVPTVKGYQLKTDLNQKVEINDDHKTLTLKYEKASTAVQAQFIDEDTGEAVAKPLDLDDVKFGKHVIKDLIGDKLPTVADYKLTTDLNEEVEISEANTTVTVKYAKKTATVKAEFVDQDTGKEVAKPVELADIKFGKHTIKDLIGDKLPTLADYTLQTDLAQEITVGDDNKTLTLKYAKKTATVKANFVDKETGKEVAKSVELNDVTYGKHTIKDLLGDQVPTVDTYTLATDLNQEVEINDGNQTLTVQYEKKTTTVKAQFIDQETGAEVAVAVDLPNVKYGKHTIKDLIGNQLPTLNDYTLTTDLNQEFDVNDENKTLTLKYDKKTTTYTIRFADFHNHDLADPVQLPRMKYGTYTVNELLTFIDKVPVFDDYTLWGDNERKVKVDGENNKLTLHYEKKKTMLKAEFVDQDTNKEVAKPVDLADVEYGKYTIKDLISDKLPTVGGYKLVTDLNQEVTVDDKHKTLTLKFEKSTTTVKAEFIDQDTDKAIADAIELSDVKFGKHTIKELIGDKLPTVNDYKLITDLDQEVEINKDTKTLTLKYEKKTATVKAKFVDEKTGKEVAKSIELTDVKFGKHTIKDLMGDQVPTVNDYKLVTDLNQEIDVNDEHKTLTLKYAAEIPESPLTTTVTTKFVDKDTKKDVAPSIALPDIEIGTQVIRNMIGDRVPTVEGYKLVTDLDGTFEVTGRNKPLILEYEAEKPQSPYEPIEQIDPTEDRRITAEFKFVDADGGSELADAVKLENMKEGRYDLKPIMDDHMPTIIGYHVKDTVDKEVTIDKDHTVVEVQFEKDAPEKPNSPYEPIEQLNPTEDRRITATFKFIDADTNSELAEAVKIDDMKEGRYALKPIMDDHMPTIIGYHVKDTIDKEVTITEASPVVEVQFEKDQPEKPDSPYEPIEQIDPEEDRRITATFKFVDEKTGVELTDALKLENMKEGLYDLNAIMKDHIPTIDGYHLDHSFDSEVKITKDHSVVAIPFEKDKVDSPYEPIEQLNPTEDRRITATFKFVDADGGKEIADAAKIDNMKEGRYALKPIMDDHLPTVDGYHVKDSLEREVTITEANSVVEVQFEKDKLNSPYEPIEQIDPEEDRRITGTFKFVDADGGAELAEAIKIDNMKEGRYDLQAIMKDQLPTIIGYHLMGSLDKEVTITKDDSVVEIQFEKDEPEKPNSPYDPIEQIDPSEDRRITAQFKFVDAKTGSELAEAVKIDDMKEGLYALKPIMDDHMPTIIGYHVKDTIDKQVKITEANPVVTIEFEQDKPESPYEPIEQIDPEEDRRITAQFKFVDADGGKELADAVNIDNMKEGKYALAPIMADKLPTIDGYHLKDTLERTVTVTEASPAVEIQFEKDKPASPYEPIEQLNPEEDRRITAQIKFVDVDGGKELAKSVSIENMKEGRYDFAPIMAGRLPEIDGYHLKGQLQKEVTFTEASPVVEVQFEKDKPQSPYEPIEQIDPAEDRRITAQFKFVDAADGHEVTEAVKVDNMKEGKYALAPIMEDHMPEIAGYHVKDSLEREVTITEANPVVEIQMEKDKANSPYDPIEQIDPNEDRRITATFKFVDAKDSHEVSEAVDIADMKEGRYALAPIMEDHMPQIDGYHVKDSLEREVTITEAQPVVTIEMEKDKPASPYEPIEQIDPEEDRRITAEFKFADADGGKELAKSVSIENMKEGRYALSPIMQDKLPAIDGYHLKGDLEREFTITEAKPVVEIEFEKDKPASPYEPIEQIDPEKDRRITAQIKFVDADGGKELAKAAEIKDMKEGRYEFAPIMADRMPEIDGYHLKGELQKEVTFTEANPVVEVQFEKNKPESPYDPIEQIDPEKDRRITAQIKFVDADGGKELAKMAEIKDMKEGRYEFTPIMADRMPEIDGYHLKGELAKEVTFTEAKPAVEVQFEKNKPESPYDPIEQIDPEKDRRITAEFKFVDADGGKELTDTVKIDNMKEGKYALAPIMKDHMPKIDGYHAKDSLEREVTITEAKPVVTIEMEKDKPASPYDPIEQIDPEKDRRITAQIKFVDADGGKELAKSVSIENMKEGRYDFAPIMADRMPTIDGYHLKGELQKEVTFTEANPVVEVQFEKNKPVSPYDPIEQIDPEKDRRITAQIKFVDADGGKELAKTAEIKDMKEGRYDFAPIMADRMPEIDGYHLKGELAKEVTFTEANPAVEVQFEKDRPASPYDPIEQIDPEEDRRITANFKFVDADGGKEVAKAVAIENMKEGKYSLAPIMKDHMPKVDGYHLKDSLDREVTITKDSSTVEILFEKDKPASPYEPIEQFEPEEDRRITAQFKFVDADGGEELANTVKVENMKEGRYALAPIMADHMPTIDGYHVKGSLEREFTITEAKPVVEIQFEKNKPESPYDPIKPIDPEADRRITAQFKFVDAADGHEVAEAVKVADMKEGIYALAPIMQDHMPKIDGYHVKDSLEREVTITEANPVVEIQMEKDKANSPYDPIEQIDPNEDRRITAQFKFVDAADGHEVAEMVNIADMKEGKYAFAPIMEDHMPKIDGYHVKGSLEREVTITEAAPVVTIEMEKDKPQSPYDPIKPIDPEADRRITAEFKFVDADGGKELAKALEIENMKEGVYALAPIMSDKLPTIDGYHLKGSLEKEVTITKDSKVVEIEFEKDKPASPYEPIEQIDPEKDRRITAEFKFVDVDGGKELTDAVKIANMKEGRYALAPIMKDHMPTIDGYHVKDSLEREVKITEANPVVEIQMEKDKENSPYDPIEQIDPEADRRITAEFKFVDADGGKELAKSLSIENMKEGRYDLEPIMKDKLPTIDGYHLKGSLTREFTITEANSVVEIQFEKDEAEKPNSPYDPIEQIDPEKDRRVTAEFKFVDANGVSRAGKELAESVKIENMKEGRYALAPIMKDHMPKIDGYHLKDSLEREVTITEAAPVVEIQFEKDATEKPGHGNGHGDSDGDGSGSHGNGHDGQGTGGANGTNGMGNNADANGNGIADVLEGQNGKAIDGNLPQTDEEKTNSMIFGLVASVLSLFGLGRMRRKK